MARIVTLPFRLLWWLLKQWKPLLLAGGSLYFGFLSGKCLYENPSSPRSGQAVSSGSAGPSSQRSARRKRRSRSFSSSPNSLRFFNRTLRRLQIRTFRVRRQPLQKWLHLRGRVRWAPGAKVNVRAPVAGTLTSWVGRERGAQVTAGAALCRLRIPSLVPLQERWLSLQSRRTDPPSPSWRARSRQLRVALLRAGMSVSALASLGKKKKPSPFLTITAPQGGRLLHRFVQTQQSVRKGQSLAQLGDPRRVSVQFSVDVRWSSGFRVGERLSWASTGHPGRRFEAIVTRLGATAGTKLTLFARFSRPYPSLRPGLSLLGTKKLSVGASGALRSRGALGNKDKDPLVLPTSSVLWNGRSAYVFVREVHKTRGTVRYLRRAVRVTGRFQEWAVVLQGLREKETVVSHGAGFLDAELTLRKSQIWGHP